MSRKHLARLSFILFMVNTPLLAQNAGADLPTKIAPPWVMRSDAFLMAAFNLKPDDVKKLLPKGVEPLVNKEGMVGALLEMYETKRAAGIPNYKTAFIVVDIQGHDSREGMPGHFAVWGRVNPRESLEAFRGNFGFPYEYETNISLLAGQDVLQGAVGAPGKEILKVKLAPIAERVFESEGSVNMVGMNADSGTVKAEVPYITKGNFAKVLNVEVRPKGDPVLKLIKNATPTWALISKDQVFSYSHALFAD